MGVTGRIIGKVYIYIYWCGCGYRRGFTISSPQPTWYPYVPLNGHYLEVSLSFPTSLWPWSGYLAVSLSITKAARHYSGTAEGHIALTVSSPPNVSHCGTC